jgi:hypothetical protein
MSDSYAIMLLCMLGAAGVIGIVAALRERRARDVER